LKSQERWRGSDSPRLCRCRRTNGDEEFIRAATAVREVFNGVVDADAVDAGELTSRRAASSCGSEAVLMEEEEEERVLCLMSSRLLSAFGLTASHQRHQDGASARRRRRRRQRQRQRRRKKKRSSRSWRKRGREG